MKRKEMDFIRAPHRSVLMMCALLPLSISQSTLANTSDDSTPAPLSVTVKTGDTLTRILADVLGSYDRWREVAAHNSLTPPYELQPGDKLVIPAAVVAEAESVADSRSTPRGVVSFTEAQVSAVEETEPAVEDTESASDESEIGESEIIEGSTVNTVDNNTESTAEVAFTEETTVSDTATTSDGVSSGSGSADADSSTDSDPTNTGDETQTTTAAADTTPEPAAPNSDVNVVVKPGDTLSQILLSTTGSYRALNEVVEYNKLANPNTLEPGDIVAIPSYLLPTTTTTQPVTPTAETAETSPSGDLEVSVRNGDTLSSILLRSVGSSHSLADVARYNNLPSPDALAAGSVISIPAYLLDKKSVEWEITPVTTVDGDASGSVPEAVSESVTESTAESDTDALANVDDTSALEDSTTDTTATAVQPVESPSRESAGSEQLDTREAETSDSGDDGTESDDGVDETSNLSFEIDGIFAVETERFDTSFEDGTPDSRNGTDLIQLRTNARLNLTESSSIGAKLYNKPVDFPNRNEIFYFDTQDFYLAKLFYEFENDDHRLQIGKISVGDGFLGRTSTYYGNQITSKDYDEKIGVNYFSNFDVSTYNLNYALSAFYDDTTRLSSSLEGKRDRNRLEDDIPGRTDQLNNLFAGVSFGLGGSDSVYLGHAARSTRLEPFSHQDTWLGVSKTIYDGESIYARVVGDLIHREDGLANSRDTSLSAGIYARASRGSVFLSLETERDRIQFPDGNAKFAELIVVYDITDNFFIEAAAKYEDLNTETTTAQAIAFIYYFEFDTAD
jgi:LysM repeat protein